jgi:thioredoxin 1
MKDNMNYTIKIKLLVLLILGVCFKASLAQVTIVSDASFKEQVLNHNGLVVVKAFTSACSSCQQIAQLFQQASEQIGDVKFVELNAYVNVQARKNYRIKSVPLILIFKNGKEVYRTNKLNSVQALRQKLAKYL